MKKFISMLALSSVLLGFSACSSEENNVDTPVSDGRVFVKLDNVVGPTSRMTEAPKTDKESAELHNGFIVFSTPNGGIREHYEIVTSADDVVDAHTILLDELREGKTFEGIPGDVTNVAIIANTTNEELNPADFHNNNIKFKADIFARKLQLRNQYADNMNHVALYDMKQLQGSAGVGSMSATLELKPMVARLEIAKITPGPNVMSYKVEGIYLAGFYKESFMNQVCDRADWSFPDYDNADPQAALDEFYKGYSYLANTDIKAVTETGIGMGNNGEQDVERDITAFYPTEDGKVWAYPFFGKYDQSPNDDHYGVRLIVKLSGLKMYLKNEQTGDMELRDVYQYDINRGIDPAVAGIRYLNISGFVEDPNNTLAEPIQFYNGNVYVVENFEVTTQYLSEKIMPADINVNLTVSVKPWVIKKVYPQI